MRDKEQPFIVRNTSFLEPFAHWRIMGNEQEKNDRILLLMQVRCAWLRKKISHSKTSISFSPVQDYAGTVPTYILCQWSEVYIIYAQIPPPLCETQMSSSGWYSELTWFLNTYVWSRDKGVPCVTMAILVTTRYTLCQKPDSAFLIWFFQTISLPTPLARNS